MFDYTPELVWQYVPGGVWHRAPTKSWRDANIIMHIGAYSKNAPHQPFGTADVSELCWQCFPEAKEKRT